LGTIALIEVGVFYCTVLSLDIVNSGWEKQVHFKCRAYCEFRPPESCVAL
jgi:hypothetical protein